MTFPNIIKRAKAEHDKRTAEMLNALSTATPEQISGKRYTQYAEYLTKRQAEKPEEERRAIIAEKIKKSRAQKWAAYIAKVERIAAAPEVESISISVEWRSNRTWGSNPTASATIRTAAGYETHESGSISGCGYDKHSTATAEALNKSDAVLKILYTAWEKALKKDKNISLRDAIGYGSGYFASPSFEGGVGIRSHQSIFNNCGYAWEDIASGKNYDSHEIRKISPAALKRMQGATHAYKDGGAVYVTYDKGDWQTATYKKYTKTQDNLDALKACGVYAYSRKD